MREAGVGSAMALSLLAVWALLHPYRGIALDAQLYAVQALAHLHPALAGDLYLQNVSQDRFTIFSPLYAALIGVWGLRSTALVLTVVSTACFFAALWGVARRLTGRDLAFVTIALFIVTGGAYGSYRVFNFLEDYLTARSVADAMVVIALACHYGGRKRLALAVAAAAMFVHPLMALPGLLLLICLWLPMRWNLCAAASGLLAVLGIALLARFSPAAARVFTVMDPEWLAVVQERSQFLFLKLWTLNDWTVNARPFLSLALTAAVVTEPALRRLGGAALLVGATGLAVAYIGGSIGPVAIFVQGQAWRWEWITALIAVLLLAPTLARLWRDEKCGPLCAVLLVCAWTFEVAQIFLCTLLPLALWAVRPHITGRIAAMLRWAAIGLGAGIIAWVLSTGWLMLSKPMEESGREPQLMQRITHVLELRIPGLMLLWAAWWLLKFTREPWLPAAAAAALLASLAVILPVSFRQITRVGSASELDEFADWRSRIPPASSVYVAPAVDSGAFVWFTLERPNYLTVNSSAGVVFSRATALEVRRRSAVLQPVENPDWKILSRLSHTGGESQIAPPLRPLTAASLAAICADPALGFVISRENAGFDPMPHRHAGSWRGWNLFDCRHVRAAADRAAPDRAAPDRAAT